MAGKVWHYTIRMHGSEVIFALCSASPIGKSSTEGSNPLLSGPFICGAIRLRRNKKTRAQNGCGFFCACIIFRLAWKECVCQDSKGMGKKRARRPVPLNG